MKIKKLLKTSVLVGLVCVITVAAFLLYFYTIGIPKTQARSYYNLAIQALEDGKKEEAIENLKTALSNWNEPYIAAKLQEIQ